LEPSARGAYAFGVGDRWIDGDGLHVQARPSSPESRRRMGRRRCRGRHGGSGWVALGWALRGECGDDDPSCDDWVVADAIATGVALVALLGWAAARSSIAAARPSRAGFRRR
jgi:hypothetical protein